MICQKCNKDKPEGRMRKFHCAQHHQVEDAFFCLECLVPIEVPLRDLNYRNHLYLYGTHANPEKCGKVYSQCPVLN